MVIRITWGRLRAGAWNEFERAYQANVIDGKTVDGFRGRLLVQDSGDKDTGFAMSLWDNAADLEAYQQSAAFNECLATLEPFFVGEYKTHRCEVKYTDLVS
jgi:heme-degrading monooxygenase HmoA